MSWWREQAGRHRSRERGCERAAAREGQRRRRLALSDGILGGWGTKLAKEEQASTPTPTT